MNREIKFRVFDQVSKKIYPVKSIWGFPEIEYVCIPDEHGVETIFHSFEMMQFTGLKDKNGIDIYEGDILKLPFNNGIAFVINDGFMFCVGVIISK